LHRRHALDGDVVLDERRHPVEVAAVRPSRVRPGPCAVVGLECQTVQFRVDRLGAGDRRIDELARRDLAGTESFDEADGVKVAMGVPRKFVAEGMDAIHVPTVPTRTAYSTDHRKRPPEGEFTWSSQHSQD
jgi:hypothetical protein